MVEYFFFYFEVFNDKIFTSRNNEFLEFKVPSTFFDKKQNEPVTADSSQVTVAQFSTLLTIFSLFLDFRVIVRGFD